LYCPRTDVSGRGEDVARGRDGARDFIRTWGVGWFAVFRSRRMAVLFLLGFSSGLPLMLTGQTLQAWLTAEHISLEQIGAMSLVGLAYTLKFAVRRARGLA